MYNRRNWKKRSKQFQKEKQRRKSAKQSRRRKTKQSKSDSKSEKLLSLLFQGYNKLKAPVNFSLLNNEKETLSFLKKIRDNYRRSCKVVILLDEVDTISTDAILVLLSNMVQFKAANIGFNGTRPKNKFVDRKLESSGFYKYLYDMPILDQDMYTFKKMTSHIYTHGQKDVAAKEADQLVKYASETVWGTARRCQGIQTTLVELMHNTHDHASKIKGDKHWWLSVEHDEKNHEVTFSFIDFGVGIFRSLENKEPGEPLYGSLDYITKLFPFATTEVDKLKLILEGKVVLTQTNEYYRGRGLRKIYTKYINNQLSDLSIISNYASARVAQNDYHSIKDEFEGTFISFKMNSNTKSLQWEI